ncbi:hypothetical protein [Flavobacterium foetidum]|uniref:hypothetical protein n=1 Tax=Flavobacterium foetidum TaxID=2026681 RepID=UPI001075487C|nr:hypothetical protein [Flavobacterium foetidum]KAF2511847.1 hypothetical protein E0W73_16090 [Flavobacterium foetidum]
MNQQKFPLAIYQKPTIIEVIMVVILTSLIFVPFIYAVNTKQAIFFLLSLVGLICFKIFNTVTKNKFLPSGIINKDILISFSENGLEINENQRTTIHQWSNLEKIKISIYAYDGRMYGRQKSYYGFENSIQFIENGQKFKYRFYIENVNQFKSLKEQFHKTILPLLNQYQNLKEESYLEAQLNFARNYNNWNNDTDYV